MNLLVLINLLLILAGPFAVVGAITAVAAVSWSGLANLLRPLTVSWPRLVARPRLVVAW